MRVSFSSKKGGGKKLLPAAGENLVEYSCWRGNVRGTKRHQLFK